MHYNIAGYPSNIPLIVSDEGYGKNEYIETTRPLVVITAPGPEAERWQPACPSFIMSTSVVSVPDMRSTRHFQSEHPLKHPVNLAYEAATADLNDVNMIDPFHLKHTVSPPLTTNLTWRYSRYKCISSESLLSPYKSPTDMGVMCETYHR